MKLRDSELVWAFLHGLIAKPTIERGPPLPPPPRGYHYEMRSSAKDGSIKFFTVLVKDTP